MNETLKIVTTILGGLALFIYGMNYMSDGLQKAAGKKMKNILAMLTKNPVVGVLAGAIVTAVLQSSSATTVLIIGFVSAGLMELKQAISVVLGANVGTTITAQLIAFKIGDYAWMFVFIGFVMMFFLKKYERISQIGQIIFGFGVLFVGINIMGEVMNPLASSPVFTDLMMKVKDVPVLGVLVGIIMTTVVQSSSATIAVLQNLAATAGADGNSILGLSGAIPILFGDNIGTTITAMLASIGASVNAKRTALAHVIFNLTGTFIFIWFIPTIVKVVTYISPKGSDVEVIARQIANTHLMFNFTNTLLFLPFIWVLALIVTKLIPGSDEGTLKENPIYLDEHILDRPIFAMHLAVQELVRLAGFTKDMLLKSKDAYVSGDKERINYVLETEQSVNKLQDKIVAYLSKILATDQTTEEQREDVAALFHVAADIEHIGDHCENLAELAIEKHENKYIFSDVAYAEIVSFYDKIALMLDGTIKALKDDDKQMAEYVVETEDDINETERRLRKRHMERLNDNTCSPIYTVLYMDTIHNIEKVGDFCENIAGLVLNSTHKRAISDDV